MGKKCLKRLETLHTQVFAYDIELDTECHIEIELDIEIKNSSTLSFNCLP